MESLYLSKVIFEFFQEGNTDGTTEESEVLTVEMQSCLDSLDQGRGYMVLRTNSGWSFDSVSELTDIINCVETTMERCRL